MFRCNEYATNTIIVALSLQINRCMNIFNKYYEIEVIDGKSREKIYTIPEVAFREAIANALIHRTYDVSSSIKGKMFEDYIEIVSSGSLTFDISEEDYKKIISFKKSYYW